MEPIQCRMARAALGLRATDLAAEAQVAPNTVRRFEACEDARQSSVKAIRKALEAKGVVFLEDNGDGPGIRCKETKAK